MPQGESVQVFYLRNKILYNLFHGYELVILPQKHSDMNSMEKPMLLDELFALQKADNEREAKLLKKLDLMTEQLLTLNENSL